MLQTHPTDNTYIYWGNGGSYDSGTILTFYGRDHVHFDNELLPPGEVVHGWSSTGNYQSNRSVTPLPLLKRETTYQLTIDMTPVPERGLFTRITFYDRYGEVTHRDVTKTNELIFTYPKDAYHYTITLISAGMTELTFHHLEIKEVTPLVQESGSTSTETTR